MGIAARTRVVKRLSEASSPLVSLPMVVGFVAPALLVLAMVFAYPLLYNVGLGFTNRSVRHYYDYHFVGVDNFVRLLTKGEFYLVVARTLLFTGVNVALQIAVGLGLALLCTSKRLRIRPIVRSLLIVPWVVPVYISVLVWRSFFLTDFGMINQVLQAIGLPTVPWLISGWWGMVAINIVQLWLAYPFVMTISLGALQSVPPDLYDAAAVDGAGGWACFRYITWPWISPIITFVALLTGNTTFQLFIVQWFLTRGGPAGSTDLVMSWGYKTAFIAQRYGYQAAFMTVISVAVIMVAK